MGCACRPCADALPPSSPKAWLYRRFCRRTSRSADFAVDRSGVVPSQRRSPVFSGPVVLKTEPQHRCAPVERASTEAFRPRALLVTTVSSPSPAHRQQPGPFQRQRTTPSPLGSGAPSAAESRVRADVSAVAFSSRHSYAGFATSAELPTWLHAMRACARSSSRPTSPPRRRKATCRPSTFTNLDDPRAHPRTLATSASGLASHLQPSDPLA